MKANVGDWVKIEMIGTFMIGEVMEIIENPETGDPVYRVNWGEGFVGKTTQEQIREVRRCST